MSVSQEQYDAVLDNLKWVHAIASILVESQGGKVNITKELLTSFDLRGDLRITDLGEVYEVLVVPPVVEGEVVDE